MAQLPSNSLNDDTMYSPSGNNGSQGLNSTRSTTVKIIRYGILGCAGIASKIARAIALEPGSQVTVVASRDEQIAANFVVRHCPQAKPATYSQLIESDNVDVVYIPIPTAVKLPWIIKAIGAV